MKQAFAYSILLHVSVALIILFLMNFSFRREESKHIQLSMEVFNNNEGKGSAARGIESSTSNVNVKSSANSAKNAQNNVVEKKEDKKQDKKEEKKIDDNKNKVVKKEKQEKKEQKKEQQQASAGALMAAKGKTSGTGAGEKGKSDGAPKSTGGVDGVYTLKEVDFVPKSLKSARPVYPEYAKNMRIEGYVQIKFIVNDKGEIINPKVVKSEPGNVFEKAALNAVKQWKFKPAVKDGRDVNVAMVVKLNFKLDEH